MYSVRKDMSGQRFRYVVGVSVSHVDTNGDCHWLFRCDCGKEFTAKAAHVRAGRIKSCGCKQHALIHGGAIRGKQVPEYGVWNQMIQRCTNPRNKRYKDYGGRGIKVCARWLGSFKNFLSDMGPRPSRRYSIDRRDNDGNYTPSNCRWATLIEQANNRRKPVHP